MAFSERGCRRADSFSVATLIEGQREISIRVGIRHYHNEPLPGDNDLWHRARRAITLLEEQDTRYLNTEQWFRLYEQASDWQNNPELTALEDQIDYAQMWVLNHRKRDAVIAQLKAQRAELL